MTPCLPHGETGSETLDDFRLDTQILRDEVRWKLKSPQLQVHCSSFDWHCSGPVNHFGQYWVGTEILPSPKASFVYFQPKCFSISVPLTHP